MDETGCVSKPDKNIKMKCVVHLDSRVFPRKKENTDYRQISIISAITLDGESLKPLIIVPRKRYEKEIENESLVIFIRPFTMLPIFQQSKNPLEELDSH